MAEDKLQKELLDIQEKLGGTREVPPEGTVDKLQWHLDKLEELAGGGGGGEEVPTFEASTFEMNPPAGTFQLELAEEDIADILENTYTLIKISAHDTVFPFVLSTGQASTVAAYTSVFSLMGQRFLLDFALQAGQIVNTGAAMINTSNIADIKVDNTSVVDQTGSVNLATKTAYNADTNKLVTESDIPTGGGKVYMHRLTFTSSENLHVIVYTGSSTPFNASTWYWWLKNNGFTYKTNCLPFISNDGQISKTTTKVVINSGVFASANSPYCTRFETNINITPGTGIDSITYTETGTQPNRDIVIEM